MTDSSSHIFPTTHRSRHSKFLSYPVGAELLSRALNGVPQHGDITCDFTTGSVHATDVVFVMSVMYRRRARTFYDGADAEERGVLDARWSITVFAVPRVERHAIRVGLESEVLPSVVRPWLVEQAAVAGRIGDAALTITYETIAKRLLTAIRDGIQPERR